MTFAGGWRSVKDFLEQAFMPREVFFRSGDRFHHLRFSARSQRYAAAIGVLAGVWGLYASVSFVVHEVTLAARDRQIADQRLAYFDLLSEVGEYHTQFSRITKDLEENQAYLLSLLEQGPRDPTDLAAIQGRLKSSETEHARVVLAREGLRAKMVQFESDLLEMAGKNIMLRTQIAQTQDLLENSRAERDQVAAARERLVTRLSEIERELAETNATKLELETTVASLQRGLKASQGARQELETENSVQNERIVGLEQDLGAAHAEQAESKDRIAGLDASLAQAIDRGDALRGRRDSLERRVQGLEQRLVDLRDAEQGVIERLSERTKLSVKVIEKTVAMTGLDVDTLIAQVDNSGLGQGGPFVPADEGVAEFGPSAQLGSTVNLLDEQLDRWTALRDVVGALPLTSPLDQYRISSAFGARKDPLNGRKARHRGIDFAAPTRTSVYATAPGKVVFAGWRGRFGRTIEIDHGHGIRTRYGHLRKIQVKAGETVDHRQKIGLVGSSGRSTGPHVHYEIRFKGQAQNPMKFLKAGKYVFKD
ncbi:MAG: peptidoglycan DD-metalloendopeptidase family protein [Kiloniellales bacterium]